MKRMIVAGNWKMHTDRMTGMELADEVHHTSGVRAALAAGAEVVVCPPTTHLDAVGSALSGSGIGLGGQTCHPDLMGAHTGDVSAAMLKSVGCTHCIVGHSERRRDHGETDAAVADAMSAVHTAGIIPIVCVGETLDEREAGTTEQVLHRQLTALLQWPTALTTAIIAYEPVWAIGTGKTATTEQIAAAHAQIKKVLAEAGIDGVPVLYGGSVTAANARELFGLADVHGGLVGGASLKAPSFSDIAAAAAEARTAS
jgi:triosephosphate isomerase (TIM)